MTRIRSGISADGDGRIAVGATIATRSESGRGMGPRITRPLAVVPPVSTSVLSAARREKIPGPFVSRSVDGL